MITIKKMKTFILSLALMAGVTAFAQAPVQQQQETTTLELTSGELDALADIHLEIFAKSQEGQLSMLKAIENEGMTSQRYQELHIAQTNSTMGDVNATEEELATKERVDMALEKLQHHYQLEQEAILEKNGMSLERFQEIEQALQANPSLMDGLREKIMKKSQN